jgi:hypothetical protein
MWPRQMTDTCRIRGRARNVLNDGPRHSKILHGCLLCYDEAGQLEIENLQDGVLHEIKHDTCIPNHIRNE